MASPEGLSWRHKLGWSLGQVESRVTAGLEAGAPWQAKRDRDDLSPSRYRSPPGARAQLGLPSRVSISCVALTLTEQQGSDPPPPRWQGGAGGCRGDPAHCLAWVYGLGSRRPRAASALHTWRSLSQAPFHAEQLPGLGSVAADKSVWKWCTARRGCGPDLGPRPGRAVGTLGVVSSAPASPAAVSGLRVPVLTEFSFVASRAPL